VGGVTRYERHCKQAAIRISYYNGAQSIWVDTCLKKKILKK
jgi:hypothetical protein